MTLQVVPLTLKKANELVMKFHRHHKRVVGHRFSIGVHNEFGQFVGCAIVGRPVARKTDQYMIAEITRLATDGTKNACSILYSSCARAAKAMGFIRIQSFILNDEPGTSLKAAGWTFDGISPGGDWNVRSRGNRRTDQPMIPKQRWIKILREYDAPSIPPCPVPAP